MTEKTCENCRHHRVEMRPKVLDTAFDTVVAFADVDEKVYFCMSQTGSRAGQTIGTIPVSCEAHEAPKRDLTALDALLAKAAERASAKPEREQ